MCTFSSGARSTFYPLMARQLGLAPPVLVMQGEVKAKLLMAIAFVMNWDLSISIPIRW
jgi:hypothetical protein